MLSVIGVFFTSLIIAIYVVAALLLPVLVSHSAEFIAEFGFLHTSVFLLIWSVCIPMLSMALLACVAKRKSNADFIAFTQGHGMSFLISRAGPIQVLWSGTEVISESFAYPRTVRTWALVTKWSGAAHFVIIMLLLVVLVIAKLNA